MKCILWPASSILSSCGFSHQAILVSVKPSLLVFCLLSRNTKCPARNTKCPARNTKYRARDTKCPARTTKCRFIVDSLPIHCRSIADPLPMWAYVDVCGRMWTFPWAGLGRAGPGWAGLGRAGPAQHTPFHAQHTLSHAQHSLSHAQYSLFHALHTLLHAQHTLHSYWE